jgi:NAD(P)-dependent dehydrogenase (short-subunit alcohol dehydrogenase family)
MTATKVAVVSGAAQGIGRRTAELLATRGYALALADLQPMPETTANIRKAGGEVLDLQVQATGELRRLLMAGSAARAARARRRHDAHDGGRGRRS